MTLLPLGSVGSAISFPVSASLKVTYTVVLFLPPSLASIMTPFWTGKFLAENDPAKACSIRSFLAAVHLSSPSLPIPTSMALYSFPSTEFRFALVSVRFRVASDKCFCLRVASSPAFASSLASLMASSIMSFSIFFKATAVSSLDMSSLALPVKYCLLISFMEPNNLSVPESSHPALNRLSFTPEA